jgi:hypothetical protein
MSENVDIKFYYTSLEPRMAQTISAQSIGGYCSTSVLYQEAVLSSSIGIYNTDISITFLSSSPYNNWSSLNYISIGEEIIKINGVESSGVVNVVERSFNGVLNMHLAGDTVTAVSINDVFNDVFNDDHSQYRCMCLKNLSPGAVVANIELYMAHNNQNPKTDVKIAVEVPSSQYLNSYSTSWTSITLVDDSIKSSKQDSSNVPPVEWVDNQCQGAYLRVLSGPNEGYGRVISSYDSLTGTFTFDSSFPYDYDLTKDSPTVQYEVDPAPAQRLKSGTAVPVLFGSTSTTKLIDATSSYIIGVGQTGQVGARLSINSLNYNDVLYVWIERAVEDNYQLYESNNVSLVLYYSVG